MVQCVVGGRVVLEVVPLPFRAGRVSLRQSPPVALWLPVALWILLLGQHAPPTQQSCSRLAPTTSSRKPSTALFPRAAPQPSAPSPNLCVACFSSTYCSHIPPGARLVDPQSPNSAVTTEPFSHPPNPVTRSSLHRSCRRRARAPNYHDLSTTNLPSLPSSAHLAARFVVVFLQNLPVVFVSHPPRCLRRLVRCDLTTTKPANNGSQED